MAETNESSEGTSLMLFDNQGPLEVVVILSIVVPLVVLGGICWIFWRARNDR